MVVVIEKINNMHFHSATYEQIHIISDYSFNNIHLFSLFKSVLLFSIIFLKLNKTLQIDLNIFFLKKSIFLNLHAEDAEYLLIC